MSLENKYIITVVGPTAVGKTALSVLLAREYDTCVISADSRQIYKELSIGTAKPSKEEQEGIVHYFIDSLSITESFNAGIFERQGLKLIEELFKKHDVIIVCGGTGLYIKALLEGMDTFPETDPYIRNVLLKEFTDKGLNPMVEELKEVDELTYRSIDLQNPVRVLRALEVYRQTGIPISDFRKGSRKERSFHTIKIGLTMERSLLNERIDKRMDAMLAAGLENEAYENIEFRHLNALQTVGYTEVFGHLDGEYAREEMVRLLKRNSRRYAKRQMTWFGKDSEINWFQPNQVNEIVSYINKKLK
jgi:tRNA dimethylallyltransferase